LQSKYFYTIPAVRGRTANVRGRIR